MKWRAGRGFLWALAAATLALPAHGDLWPRHAQDRDRALQAGRAALEDGLYEVAEKYIEQYVRLASSRKDRAEGTLLLARALFGQQRYDDVVQLLSRRISWARRMPSEAGFVLWQALAWYELGKYEDALRSLADFKLRYPESPYRPQAARLQTKCLVKMQEITEALQAFARFQETYPESPEIPVNLLDWAGTLIRLGRKDEARQVFDQLLSKYPDSDAAARGQLWLGGVYATMGELNLAIEVLTALIGQPLAQPEYRASAWFALADIQESRTNFPTALEALDQILALGRDPATSARAESSKGRVLIRLGRLEEGTAAVKAVITRGLSDPAPAELQLDLAEALLAGGHFERAEREFQYYLEAFSDRAGTVAAWMGKGWSLWGMKQYSEAAAAFEQAYGHSTDASQRARALFKIGDCNFANRQYQLALEHYRRVAEEFPDESLAAEAKYQAAESLDKLDKMDEAESLFHQLAKETTDLDLAQRAQLRIAQVRERAGQWEKAVEAYDQLLKDGVRSTLCEQALHSRGLIRYRLGQFKEAMSDFEQVLSDYPGSRTAEQAFYMRGWALYLLGKDQEALALCRNFLVQHPQSSWAPDVLFWLGEYHFNRGEYAEAEKNFARLAEQYPGGELADDALFWAGRSAATRKEYLQAIEYFNRLAQTYADSPKLPETRFAQGDALSELGQFGGAILAFDEVIKKYPGSPLADPALGRKGDCQFTLGKDDPRRYTEALGSYRMLLKSPKADPDLKWQAEFKMGRCLEKMDRPDEAIETYMNVVYGFLTAYEKGAFGNPLWFTRAAFNAGSIMESQSKWREAAQVYKRVAAARVPASAEAQARIRQIQSEHWILF